MCAHKASWCTSQRYEALINFCKEDNPIVRVCVSRQNGIQTAIDTLNVFFLITVDVDVVSLRRTSPKQFLVSSIAASCHPQTEDSFNQLSDSSVVRNHMASLAGFAPAAPAKPTLISVDGVGLDVGHLIEVDSADCKFSLTALTNVRCLSTRCVPMAAFGGV